MTDYSRLIHDIYSSPLGWIPTDLNKKDMKSQRDFWMSRADQLLNTIIGMVMAGAATTEQIKGLNEQLRHPQST